MVGGSRTKAYSYTYQSNPHGEVINKSKTVRIGDHGVCMWDFWLQQLVLEEVHHSVGGFRAIMAIKHLLTWHSGQCFD